VTAHCRQSEDRLDWQQLAAEKQTLAIYMGVKGLDRLQGKLLEYGRHPDTPFAWVENGTRADQRVICGRLSALVETSTQHDVRSPALLIIGEVAALAGHLHWFGSKPLALQQNPAIELAA
jgi:uroporphyrin-III C-methyltransferase/precorrin-2 dehydrogenase/sirohydrochlorin ferrochelatase